MKTSDAFTDNHKWANHGEKVIIKFLRDKCTDRDVIKVKKFKASTVLLHNNDEAYWFGKGFSYMYEANMTSVSESSLCL